MDQSLSPDSMQSSAPVTGRDLSRIRANPDFWYPVAWSRELKPGKTIGTRYAGQPIALVRPKEGGSVFALEDRCAHRQVPLSKGTVKGESVQCCYHGWAYGRSGRCIDVPYLGKGKLPNGVRTYPVREADGLIFVFPGDPAKAEATPFPRLAEVANPAYKTRRFGQLVRCHYSFMHENLMDMNHQFMHMKQMGQMKPRFLGQERGPGLVEARYSFARTGGKQPIGEALIFGQKRDNSEKFAHRDVMTIRTTYPYQTLHIQTGDSAPVMDLWIAYVPQDEAELTNRVFGLLSIKRPGIPGILDLAWPFLTAFTERIFREDREIVELEQNAWYEQGGDRNQEIFPVICNLRELLVECGLPARQDAPAPVARGALPA
ncbi:Rieske (2Fe-2S) protein [Komagataeibacter xylinus]|nr:Rieske (2Fe-2S) domain protein [Komagataeibacter xylinus E25]RFP04995.1 Rieske (2Fe-2S) protein [Komagataeibacter xylinus]RFP07736.1 Rieske (2Fe-2S) protein [Komagataeibacter xylinus]